MKKIRLVFISIVMVLLLTSCMKNNPMTKSFIDHSVEKEQQIEESETNESIDFEVTDRVPETETTEEVASKTENASRESTISYTDPTIPLESATEKADFRSASETAESDNLPISSTAAAETLSQNSQNEDIRGKNYL